MELYMGVCAFAVALSIAGYLGEAAGEWYERRGRDIR